MKHVGASSYICMSHKSGNLFCEEREEDKISMESIESNFKVAERLISVESDDVLHDQQRANLPDAPERFIFTCFTKLELLN